MLKQPIKKYTPNPIYTIKGNIYGSSVIKGFAYDENNKVLQIHFMSGNSTRYRDVPLATVRGLQQAASAGVYFNQYIKLNYQTY